MKIYALVFTSNGSELTKTIHLYQKEAETSKKAMQDAQADMLRRGLNPTNYTLLIIAAYGMPAQVIFHEAPKIFSEKVEFMKMIIEKKDFVLLQTKKKLFNKKELAYIADKIKT